jgi:hypothetical protein
MRRMRRRNLRLGNWRAAAGLLAFVAVACGPQVSRPSATDSASLRDLDGRVSAAWSTVSRYRTVERIERAEVGGTWELTTPPVATDFVLPDRKYRRPAERTDFPGYEFIVVGPTIYQKIEGQWSIVDWSQIPAESELARSLEQFRTGGLDGSPFRLPPDVDGKMTPSGSEMLDGRLCRWYGGTALGPAGPVQLRVAIEEGRDLPCRTEAEYDGPAGRARNAIRYFDYNAAIQIEPPTPVS